MPRLPIFSICFKPFKSINSGQCPQLKFSTDLTPFKLGNEEIAVEVKSRDLMVSENRESDISFNLELLDK